jgi:hypothetical protein
VIHVLFLLKQIFLFILSIIFFMIYFLKIIS